MRGASVTVVVPPISVSCTAKTRRSFTPVAVLGDGFLFFPLGISQTLLDEMIVVGERMEVVAEHVAGPQIRLLGVAHAVALPRMPVQIAEVQPQTGDGALPPRQVGPRPKGAAPQQGAADPGEEGLDGVSSGETHRRLTACHDEALAEGQTGVSPRPPGTARVQAHRPCVACGGAPGRIVRTRSAL